MPETIGSTSWIDSAGILSGTDSDEFPQETVELRKISIGSQRKSAKNNYRIRTGKRRFPLDSTQKTCTAYIQSIRKHLENFNQNKHFQSTIHSTETYRLSLPKSPNKEIYRINTGHTNKT